MSFIQKILNVLNMDNWEKKDNLPYIIESKEKDEILYFLQSKIDYANKLIDKARKTRIKSEFYNYINEVNVLFYQISKSGKEQQTEDVGNNPYDKYCEGIRKQKENNMSIYYEDIKDYDMKPFDLKGKFISDGDFTIIELWGGKIWKFHINTSKK